MERRVAQGQAGQVACSQGLHERGATLVCDGAAAQAQQGRKGSEESGITAHLEMFVVLQCHGDDQCALVTNIYTRQQQPRPRPLHAPLQVSAKQRNTITPPTLRCLLFFSAMAMTSAPLSPTLTPDSSSRRRLSVRMFCDTRPWGREVSGEME